MLYILNRSSKRLKKKSFVPNIGIDTTVLFFTKSKDASISCLGTRSTLTVCLIALEEIFIHSFI